MNKPFFDDLTDFQGKPLNINPEYLILENGTGILPLSHGTLTFTCPCGSGCNIVSAGPSDIVSGLCMAWECQLDPTKKLLDWTVEIGTTEPEYYISDELV